VVKRAMGREVRSKQLVNARREGMDAAVITMGIRGVLKAPVDYVLSRNRFFGGQIFAPGIEAFRARGRTCIEYCKSQAMGNHITRRIKSLLNYIGKVT
jgi:hypothetical protein